MPITPCLWFDGCADAAVELYLSVFPDSKRLRSSTYGEDSPGEPGETLAINFELMGTAFLALNAGPEFRFTPAVSLMIPCATQHEVDHYWDALVDGGVPSQCGWLQDRFGLSWQVVPDALGELLGDPDRARADRAMQAMLKMSKLDVAALRAAADGR